MRLVPDHRSDVWPFLAYWVFASPIILNSFHGEEWTWPVRLVYYAYMVAAYSAAAWFTVEYLFARRLRGWDYLWAMPALLAVLLAVTTGTYALDKWIIDTEASWWYATWNWNLANDAQNVLTIVAILVGKRFVDERQRAAALESERRQSELSRLRAQVDPHFLFNSLNILDVLIEVDPAHARQFVHRLSNLYRYLIRHRDEDLVPAADELRYARDYHYLVEQRFGASFAFRQNLPDADLRDRYMPPGSLQAVLENVYKHNLATERNPITITLEARGDALYVANDFSPKPGDLAPRERSGSGTANLTRRYSLLTDEEVYARREGGQWVVRLPLLTASPSSRTRAQPSGTAASRPPR